MNKVKVSVIMPVLNGMPYFKKALNSVQKQTLKDIEIIIVDAGSSDGTIAYVNELAQRDNRIRLLNAPKKSMGMQYNLGIEAAQGEYLGFCESDDYLEENMFEVLLKKMIEFNNPDYIKANFYMFIGKEGNEVSLTYNVLQAKNEDLYNKVICIDYKKDIFFHDVNMWNGIYRKEFIVNKNIRLNESAGAAFQDADFVDQTLLMAERAVYCKETFYHYRRDNEGSSVYKNTFPFAIQEFDYMIGWLNCNEEIKNKYTELVYLRFIGMIYGAIGKRVYWSNDIKKCCEELKMIQEKSLVQYHSLSKSNKENIIGVAICKWFLFNEELFCLNAKFDYEYGLLRRFKLGKELCRQKKIIIFGVGERGQSVLAFLIRNNYCGEIIFCDNNSCFEGRFVMGHRVFNVKDAMVRFPEAAIIIPSGEYYNEMICQLKSENVVEDKVYLVDDIFPHTSMELDWTVAPKTDDITGRG